MPFCDMNCVPRRGSECPCRLRSPSIILISFRISNSKCIHVCVLDDEPSVNGGENECLNKILNQMKLGEADGHYFLITTWVALVCPCWLYFGSIFAIEYSIVSPSKYIYIYI